MTVIIRTIAIVVGVLSFILGLIGIGAGWWMLAFAAILCAITYTKNYQLQSKKPFKDQLADIAEQSQNISNQKAELAAITHPQKTATKQRIADNHAAGIACCPKCGSTSLTAGKKGFGVGKAAVGALAVGPYGLLAGGLGSRKVKVTCLNCGYQFKPGK